MEKLKKKNNIELIMIKSYFVKFQLTFILVQIADN